MNVLFVGAQELRPITMELDGSAGYYHAIEATLDRFAVPRFPVGMTLPVEAYFDAGGGLRGSAYCTAIRYLGTGVGIRLVFGALPDPTQPGDLERRFMRQARGHDQEPADLSLPALVLGGADTVWDNFAKATAVLGLTYPWPGLVVATNEAGACYPFRVDAWVTLHPEKLDGPDAHWMALREALGNPPATEVWCNREHRKVDHVATSYARGTSGMLCLPVALDYLHAPGAVLCGLGMEKRRHFFDSPDGEPWPHADSAWEAWKDTELRPDIYERVRSMSGRTKGMFGLPTPEWMAGLAQWRQTP